RRSNGRVPTWQGDDKLQPLELLAVVGTDGVGKSDAIPERAAVREVVDQQVGVPGDAQRAASAPAEEERRVLVVDEVRTLGTASSGSRANSSRSRRDIS